MKPRSAIKTDLFADEHHRKKIDSLGDPLIDIESHIDFAALAAEVDRVAPRTVSAQGGRPPYPTETMVRILVLKRGRLIEQGNHRELRAAGGLYAQLAHLQERGLAAL